MALERSRAFFKVGNVESVLKVMTILSLVIAIRSPSSTVCYNCVLSPFFLSLTRPVLS